MSMKTWNVYGYGFEVPSAETVVDFIISHKDTFCQSDEEKEIYETVISKIENGNHEFLMYIDDAFEEYYCDHSDQYGLGAAISNIMTRETGIRFEYQPGMMDYPDTERIVFPEAMPWYYNEIERGLTRETLDEIINRYTEELGITKGADYEDIEYWG